MMNGVTVLDKESMRDAHAPAFANVKATPVSAFMNSKYAPKVKGVDYIPGTGRLLANGGYHSLNKWSGFGIAPEEGSYPILLKFFEDMFQKRYALEHLLDCCAFLIQYPDKKIRHVFLATGGQGIGKSTLRVILEKILGHANVGTVNTGDWDKPFNAHLTDLQVAVIEELMASDQLQSYNSIKPYISEDRVLINQKHWPVYYGRTPYFWLALSNHRKPILLEPDDRRFYVVHLTAKRQTPSYYKALYDSMDAELPAFVHMLKQRDVSHFNPDAPPPETPDKAELIADSYTPVKAKLLELIEAGEGQFASDITSLSLIRVRLEMFPELKPRALETRNLQRTMKELGGIPLGPVRVGDKKPSLWAVRNAGKWDGALTSDIRQEYLRK